MNTVPAIYFDGHTAHARPVAILFDPAGFLEISGEGVALRIAQAEVSIDPPLGRTHRFIRFADGGRCEVSDPPALETALASWRPARAAQLLHQVERSWLLVVVATVLLAVLSWLVVRHGVPWGARQAAFALPAGVTSKLGQQTLDAFDKTVFQPSALGAARQQELQQKFRTFLHQAGDAQYYRIEFRHSDLFGANAFALPSGDIVITDELIALAQDDDEILGVLAHECGHVVHRHALRSVFQNSTVLIVISLITGDVSSATAFGGALPAFLLQSKFSREFENEADAHAVQMMRTAQRNPAQLANLLERLSSKAGETKNKTLSYLSSHPPTAERIEAIKGVPPTAPRP
jgi:Zn-dependent protease with chaperone function